MTPEQQDLLLKAGNKLASAKISLREGFPEDTVSRAYYSMFYVAQSLLLNVGFTGKSHRGIISAFGENLAMTGRVPTEFHRLLINAASHKVMGRVGIWHTSFRPSESAGVTGDHSVLKALQIKAFHPTGAQSLGLGVLPFPLEGKMLT
jgi:uncharacterized protein (UPF0332 family)